MVGHQRRPTRILAMSDFTKHYLAHSHPDGALEASAQAVDVGQDAAGASPGHAPANVAVVLSKLAAMRANLSFTPRGAASESPVRNDEGRRGPPQAGRTAK
jgi:hypothetical protein